MTIGALEATASIIDQADRELRDRLVAFVEAVDSARFKEANQSLESIWLAGLPGPTFWKIRELLQPLVQPLENELTLHGFKRTFRFWSTDEKRMYLQDAVDIICSLREQITPNTCLVYGAALTAGRSNDLIPHDDDIDIAIMLKREEFRTYDDGTAYVLGKLAQEGRDVHQATPNLINLYLPNDTHIDVFIALGEGDFFCSYPGPRNVIKTSDLFLPTKRKLLGVEVPLPRRLQTYLLKVYGPRWRTPDPTFAHAWDRTEQNDLFAT